MIRSDQPMAGQAAPGGEVFRGAGILRHQLEQRAGRQDPETAAELQHKLAAAHLAGVPTVGDVVLPA